MNTRPHCKISPPIGIVALSNIGSITDRLRIGFEVSRRNAACQIHKLSCWISLGAMTVEPTNSTNSNRSLIDVGKAPEWIFRAMTGLLAFGMILPVLKPDFRVAFVALPNRTVG